MTDDEKHVKHLDMIQSIITRLAGNSFTVKGWSTALVTAVLAFLSKDGKPQHAWIALIPAFAFWFLDAYYLGLERAFRKWYEIVRTGCRHDFAMIPQSIAKCVGGAIFRPSVFILHAMLVAITVLVWRCVR